MNRTEASMLLTFIARVDNRNIDRDVVEVWADMLDDIRLEDALPAAREHLRTDTRWLTPAILRQHVEDADGAGPQRQSVAEALRVPDADPDDPAAYREALRGQRYAAPTIAVPRPAGVLTSGGAR